MTKVLLLLIAALTIASCNTEKRAAKKEAKKIESAKVTFDLHPQEFAGRCATKFPPKIISSTTDKFVKGPTDTFNQSVTNDLTYDLIAILRKATDSTKASIIDSLLKHPFIVKNPCPPVYVPHDTFIHDVFQQVESTALVDSLANSNADLVKKNTDKDATIKDKDTVIKENVAVIKKKNHVIFGTYGVLILLIATFLILKFRFRIL